VITAGKKKTAVPIWANKKRRRKKKRGLGRSRSTLSARSRRNDPKGARRQREESSAFSFGMKNWEKTEPRCRRDFHVHKGKISDPLERRRRIIKGGRKRRRRRLDQRGGLQHSVARRQKRVREGREEEPRSSPWMTPRSFKEVGQADLLSTPGRKRGEGCRNS